MKNQNLHLFLLAIIFCFLSSCSYETEEFEKSTSAITEKDHPKKDWKNPYTVTNMQLALNNLKEKISMKEITIGKGFQFDQKEIKTTHLYIKFSPQNLQQEAILKRDSTLIVFDYPLEFEHSHAYYSTVGYNLTREIPEYYCSVPVDKILPEGVPYQVIDKLYLPEEDPYFDPPKEKESTPTHKNSILNKDDLFTHLLIEAYTLTGNEAELLGETSYSKGDDDTNYWIIGQKWNPEGTVQIWDGNTGTTTITEQVYSHTEYFDCETGEILENCDDPIAGVLTLNVRPCCERTVYRPVTRIVQGKYVPLEGAQILIRQLFTVQQGITNSSGYFYTASVRGKARYIIQWERYHYSIRDGALTQAETHGPKVKDKDWYFYLKGGKDEYHGHIHRAAHHYYYKNIKNLRRPPKNSSFRTQMKIRAYESGGESLGTHNSAWRAFGLNSPIKIYTYGGEPIQTYATTIHELSHASHWNMDRNGFRNIPDNEDRIKESWARGVEWELTRMTYPDYRASEIRPKYTLVVMDMIDNDNRFGNTSISGEGVSGYTIRQIEDALNGQKTWVNWKNNIKIRYNNATENNLDALFDYWD